MDVMVEALAEVAPDKRLVEIVERKGLGHPDTICDALSERLSVALSRFYLERFGLILHHNVDKALLSAGTTDPQFGGGRMHAPMNVYLAGRATTEVKGVTVPVEELAVEACRTWFRENFHALDPEKHIKFHCLVRPGSPELVELFMRQRETGNCLANDTSCGVAYAPLTALEKVVLNCEKALNSTDVKTAHPAIGQDIKIMGVRDPNGIALTVACAFVDRFIAGFDDYRVQKDKVRELVLTAAESVTGESVTVDVNMADAPERGAVYLTVTGTSGEGADDGQTGRGNRANGLIAPGRPMTLEAVAGKNPVTHVGKLYNICANRIITTVVEEVADIVEAECYLVSQIGHPIDEPRIVAVRARPENGNLDAEICQRIEEIARDHLHEVKSLWRGFLAGEFPIA